MYFFVILYVGVCEDWVVNDWGYEEIVDNINMLMFEVVFGNKLFEEVGGDGWVDEWRNFE